MTGRRSLFRPVAPVAPPRTPRGLRFLRALLRADLSHFPARTYTAPVYSVRLRGRQLHMPRGPRRLREVLVTDQADYPKSEVMRRILAPLIGRSMFVTNGAEWRRQRRMIDPTLELSRLKAFLPLMQGAVDDMIARLSAAGGKPIDVDVETMRVTADILCRTVFSEEVERGFVDRLARDFRDYQALAPQFLLLEAAGLPYWVLPHRMLRARRTGRRIRALLAPMIRARMQVDARPDDLLTGLIEARDPDTGHRFTETELTDEVVFFFLAGHETSASALSWSFYLLANDSHAQQKAHAEIAAEIGFGPVDFSSLRRLRFTRDVFREALRLYPPVTSFIRDPSGPRRLGKVDVGARDLVAVTPWFVHRSPRAWSHPDLFDPDRYQTDEGLASMRAAWLPFGVGPRVCSGAAFATQEALLVLASVLSRFSVEPVAGREPQPAAWLTQRSRNGTWLRLVPREGEDHDRGRNTS